MSLHGNVNTPNPSALLIGRPVHGYPVTAEESSTTVLTGRSGAVMRPGMLLGTEWFGSVKFYL
jgi:hypothetical protein